MKARTWAYLGLALGLSASITANVASTVLIANGVTLGLRVPFAVFWPLAVWIAIEVLIRTDWRIKSTADILIRLVIIGPVSIVGGIVSYLHQSHLMTLAGETWIAAHVGPLAVDGMILGMTATLVRKVVEDSSSIFQPLPLAPDGLNVITPDTADEIIDAWNAEPIELPSAPPAPRAPRAKSWDSIDVVNRLMGGEKPGDVVTATGASRPSVMRISKVVKALKADPRAAIDYRAERVPADVVGYIREAVTK